MDMYEFVKRYYQHFNSREVKDAVDAWVKLFENGGKMFISLGGAMSTAGIGRIIVPAIKNDLVIGVSTTGANLEEDYFRAIGYDQYQHFSDCGNLTLQDEENIRKQGFSRVYDTAIPESVMAEAYQNLLPYIDLAIMQGEKIAHHEVYYRMFHDKKVHLEDSW